MTWGHGNPVANTKPNKGLVGQHLDPENLDLFFAKR